MEENMEEHKPEQVSEQDTPRTKKDITVKINMRVIVAVVVIIFVAAALYYYKGFFVAALVNGTPISRVSVIQELEKQSGKSALDSLITKQLIEGEARKKNITVSADEVNQEIKKIEGEILKQGASLQEVLSQQGMTEERLREQITIQKKIEKILADKVSVSDAELDTYIKENKISPEKDEKPEDMKSRIKEQLKGQKFSQEAEGFVADLKASAKIQYFVKY